MVHDKDSLGTGVLELEVEFGRFVKGVAGNAHPTRLQDAEEDLRVMGEVGEKNSHFVPFLDPPGGKEIGEAVRGVLDLGIGSRDIREDGISRIGKFSGSVIEEGKERFFISGYFVGHIFGPFRAFPGFARHGGPPFIGLGGGKKVKMPMQSFYSIKGDKLGKKYSLLEINEGSSGFCVLLKSRIPKKPKQDMPLFLRDCREGFVFS
jgi:hypothetical protein